MTSLQLAIASRSSVTWLSNSSRILKRRLHRTPHGARWWGLVRMFNAEVGVSLASAAKAADAALGSAHSVHRVRLSASVDQTIVLTVDLARFHSTANAALAAALTFALPKRRGRPRRSFESAKPRPDHLSEVWTIRVDDTAESLDRLALHLREWNAYPRGIERGLPFIMDAATLRAVPTMALDSDKGPVDVMVTSRRPPERAAAGVSARPSSS